MWSFRYFQNPQVVSYQKQNKPNIQNIYMNWNNGIPFLVNKDISFYLDGNCFVGLAAVFLENTCYEKHNS